jgi:hypothetical protein
MDTAHTAQPERTPHTQASSPLVLILAWLAVGIPLLWGVSTTLKKALALFT